MLTDIFKKSTSLFLDNADTVLRGQENRQRAAALLNGSLVTNVRAETKGVSALVYKNGSYGFASTIDYSKEGAALVLNEAKNNALFLNSKEPRNLRPFRKEEKSNIETERKIIDCTQKEIIDRLKEIDSYIAKKYPSLSSRSIIYKEDSQDKIIYTSSASNGHVINPRCFIYVSLTATTDRGEPVRLTDVYGGKGSLYNYFAGIRW